LKAEGLAPALRALVTSDSLHDGEDHARRGFDVEAEVSASAIVSIANLFAGAGYSLECITAVDQEDFRELWYQFNVLDGPPHRHLLRMQLDEREEVPSISHIFGSARWFEREAFDMMGIQVTGHPNLKRLLLPEDSDFFPLRRDQCIDDELRETRAGRRKKRLAAIEKAKAKAEAAANAAAEAAETKVKAEQPTEEAPIPIETTTADGPAPLEAPTDNAAPAIDRAAEAPTQNAAPVVKKDTKS
jgi:NADH-quinone oxidoreductase subunit C